MYFLSGLDRWQRNREHCIESPRRLWLPVEIMSRKCSQEKRLYLRRRAQPLKTFSRARKQSLRRRRPRRFCRKRRPLRRGNRQSKVARRVKNLRRRSIHSSHCPGILRVASVAIRLRHRSDDYPRLFLCKNGRFGFAAPRTPAVVARKACTVDGGTLRLFHEDRSSRNQCEN
jgi:hypothetical protein